MENVCLHVWLLLQTALWGRNPISFLSLSSLAQGRYSTDICWMNKWMNKWRTRCMHSLIGPISLWSGFPRSLLLHPLCPAQSPHSAEASQTLSSHDFSLQKYFWEKECNSGNNSPGKYFLKSKGNLSWKTRKFLNTWVEDHSPLQPLWFPLQSWAGFLLNSPTCFVVHYSRDEEKSTFSKAITFPHKYVWYNLYVLSGFPPRHRHLSITMYLLSDSYTVGIEEIHWLNPYR